MTSFDVYGVELIFKPLPGGKGLVWRGAYGTLDDAQKALESAARGWVKFNKDELEWFDVFTSDLQKLAEAVEGAHWYAVIKHYCTKNRDVSSWLVVIK